MKSDSINLTDSLKKIDLFKIVFENVPFIKTIGWVSGFFYSREDSSKRMVQLDSDFELSDSKLFFIHTNDSTVFIVYCNVCPLLSYAKYIRYYLLHDTDREKIMEQYYFTNLNRNVFGYM